MRRLFMLPLLIAAFTLSACGPGTKLGDLLSIATSTVVNPVDATNIYQIKNGYAATLELAVQWREFCWAKSYAALMADPVAKPICTNRRARLRALQVAQPKAALSIDKAETFVRNNPTLNATVLVSAAWDAYKEFQAVGAAPAK